MDSSNTVCPVCTLFLRPGITLKQHLTSHPKQKVIEALVKYASSSSASSSTSAQQEEPKSNEAQPQIQIPCGTQPWTPLPGQVMPPNALHGNHFFIYQQSMSTTSPQSSNVLNVNPMSQHYVYPTVFNSLPYVYQQQQVIMSSNSLPGPMRALPFDVGNDRNATIENNESSAGEGKIVEIADHTSHKSEENEEVERNDDKPEKKEETEELESADQECTAGIEDESVDLTKSRSNSPWKYKPELNKACQTQNGNKPEEPVEETAYEDNEDRPDYIYIDQQSQEVYDAQPVAYTKTFENFEQSQPIYTSTNILQGNEHLDLVNVDDLVILNNPNQIVSQVVNFTPQPDRPGVLMTIGDVNSSQKIDFNDNPEESISSNVNIRSDECMPPRGELSGQESIDGASDITWNRLQYQDSNSKMSNSYNLIGSHDSWEMGSDTIDNPPCEPMPMLIPFFDEGKFNKTNDVEVEEEPEVVGFSGPQLNFKCSSCDSSFSSVKERKEHENKEHSKKTKRNLIGNEIGKRKVKKLVVKLRTDKETTENNFDNIFTGQLKLENGNEAMSEPNLTEPLDLKTMCTICDCVVENAKALKEHQMQVHKDVPFMRHRCTICHESFPNEYKYTLHLKIHPLECRLCGKLFYRKQNFQLHMKRHLGLKPYKCNMCDKAFVTRQKHDEHKNVHTGETPLKCNMCDEKFKRHSNLVQHRNRHHLMLKRKVKDYICHCGEIFHSKQKFAWHKEIHDPKPKACPHCSEKFQHTSSLTRHMRRAHNQKYLPEETRLKENVECPICKGTYLKSSLEVHIRRHTGQRPYTCLICNKDFTTKWNLKLHKWTHASRTTKPFRCDQCKGAFIRESDYISHMNSHKSVRPYTCNYCGMQFIRKYNCLRHVKEHENDKTFSCNVCGKMFHRSYYLKDHMRVHSGIRPYICHICGKTSTTKSNHNKHIQIHHAREPVSTEN